MRYIMWVRGNFGIRPITGVKINASVTKRDKSRNLVLMHYYAIIIFIKNHKSRIKLCRNNNSEPIIYNLIIYKYRIPTLDGCQRGERYQNRTARGRVLWPLPIPTLMNNSF
jgi:hypothetical protein